MTDLPDEETIRVRRRAARSLPGDGAVPGDAAPDDSAPDETELDDTIRVAPRGAAAPGRRRATYVDSSSPDDHTASPPDSAAAATDRVYRARHAEPTIVPRAVARKRAVQARVDVAASAAEERRRARRSALIVVSAASAVAFAAIVSLAAVALNP